MRLRGFQDKPVLFDRIPHISEQIYGPLYGRNPRELAAQLDRELIEMEPVIVYCRLRIAEDMLGFMSTEEKAHKPSAHTELVIKNYRSIALRYAEIMVRLVGDLDIFSYSWQEDNYDHLLRDLRLCAA
jgi:hypothetical protein